MRKSQLLWLAVLSISLLSFSCSGDYAMNEEDEEIANQSFALQGAGHAWTHGDWTSRVLWEARYALSQSANGYSSYTHGSGVNQKWYGDWNYIGSDSTAFNKASSEGYGIVGTTSPTLWNASANAYVHRGGWCTFFVRLALLRSTYWAFSDHYTTPNYPSSVYTVTGAMTQNYSAMQPGWVFLTPSNEHYAIAEKRETIGGQIGWWIIDSNWVCTHCIGKHFMPDSTLSAQGYYGWLPDRGTNN